MRNIEPSENVLQGFLTKDKLACPIVRRLVEMKTDTFSFGESRITEQCNCEVDNEAKVASSSDTVARWKNLPRGKLACLSGRCLVEMKTDTFSFGESRITEQCNCEVDNEAKVASSSDTVARWKNLPQDKLACLSGRCLVEMKTDTFSFGESRITEQCNCEVEASHKGQACLSDCEKSCRNENRRK